MSPKLPDATRRNFMKTTGAATVASHVVLTNTQAQTAGERLKVGLIGCGGRGSGAANQALKADDNVELYAMGDVFESQLKRSLGGLSKAFAPKPPEPKEGEDPEEKKADDPEAEPPVSDKINCPEERQFTGLDAYQKVIDSGVDVVILTTPPGFRPQHLKAAVDAGKHVFCEKPVAVDAPGIRSVLESAKKAKEIGTNIVCGFCWRYSTSRRAAFQQIADGKIGDVQSMYATYYTGPVKPMPPAENRPEGMSDVEWQVSNWYNFSWLGGDGLVEQAVHSVDKIGWAFGDENPIRCFGNGGRHNPAHGGNIFDHFSVVYEFKGQRRGYLASRQTPGCYNENADYIQGNKGTCVIGKGAPYILGEERWRFSDEDNNMYQQEHDELFAAIRKGEPINNGEWMAHSSMLAIMGRMSCYTGQAVTWDQAMESEVDLAPDTLGWEDAFEASPLPLPGKMKII